MRPALLGVGSAQSLAGQLAAPQSVRSRPWREIDPVHRGLRAGLTGASAMVMPKPHRYDRRKPQT